MTADAKLNERFTLWLNAAGEPVAKPLSEMTAGEVLQAFHWLDDEKRRADAAAAPAQAIAEMLRDSVLVASRSSGSRYRSQAFSGVCSIIPPPHQAPPPLAAASSSSTWTVAAHAPRLVWLWSD
jgi:hypothetical protein